MLGKLRFYVGSCINIGPPCYAIPNKFNKFFFFFFFLRSAFGVKLVVLSKELSELSCQRSATLTKLSEDVIHSIPKEIGKPSRIPRE